MEMSEERIAERIDANLLDVPLDQIPTLSFDMFSNKIAKLKKMTNGKLIVKEYPTGSAHSNHFRALLNELKLKKSFSNSCWSKKKNAHSNDGRSYENQF